MSITFNHKSKVGGVSLFIELASQTVLLYATKPGRFVVRKFSGCDCGEEVLHLWSAFVAALSKFLNRIGVQAKLFSLWVC